MHRPIGRLRFIGDILNRLCAQTVITAGHPPLRLPFRKHQRVENLAIECLHTDDAAATLTVDDVRRSRTYQELKPARRNVADVQTERACSILASKEPPPTRLLVARYDQVVDILATQGWLTAAQADTLSALATGL